MAVYLFGRQEADMEDTRFTEGGRGGGGFLIGLLCGAAVGATVGLLFAPKPGSELRRDLADGAGRLRRRAEEAYGDAAEVIEDGVSRAQRFGEDVISRGRKAGQRAADRARDTMNDSRRSQGNGSENPIS